MTEHRTNRERDTIRGRDDVRTSLVAATLRLLDRVPPNQLTIRAIAAEAGVNHGLVHRHFGSKGALFGAAHEHHTQLTIQTEPDTDVLEQLFAPFELNVSSPVRGRILAWAISEGIDPAELGLNYPLLQRSAALLADRHHDAENLLVFFTAAAIGWSAFESLFADAMHRDDARSQKARDAFLAYARDLLRRELSTDTRPETGE